MIRARYFVPVALVVTGLLVLLNWTRGKCVTKGVIVQIAALQVVVRQYQERIGDLPEGENLEIAKALIGANPQGLVFIAWPPKQLGPKGEFLDPWGTPLEMRIRDRRLEVRSAGPDLRFSTEDDEVSRESIR